MIDTTRPLDVHLTAIGGVGMTALAGLLTELGHRVRGSDLDVYPPASDELARLGVPIARGYRAENLEPRPDLVVMGNAISAGNPEAVAARMGGIPTISLPEALEQFCLPGRYPVVVAGTHGKTTTSSLLAWILRGAGRDPGWFIGGAPLDLPRPWATGTGAEFVLEGDEYDSAYFDKGPKFLHYRPTAIEATLAAVRSRFPAARLWALFDPRSNTSRRRVFQDDIARALAAADRVVIGPVHDVARIAPEERFSPEAAAAAIVAAGRPAVAATDHPSVAAMVEAELRRGDVVVVLSNGAFGGVVRRLRDHTLFT